MHLLAGMPDVEEAEVFASALSPVMQAARAEGDRVEALEERIQELEVELRSLGEAFRKFRSQFE